MLWDTYITRRFGEQTTEKRNKIYQFWVTLKHQEYHIEKKIIKSEISQKYKYFFNLDGCVVDLMVKSPKKLFYPS